MIHKNSKGYWGEPPTSWLSATLGKYEKINILDALKTHFQRFFALNKVFCIYYQIGYISIHWLRLRLCYRILCSMFSKSTLLFDFIKRKRINWLNILVMSRTRFRGNPHSIVAWMSRNSLLEAGAKSEV